MKKGDQYYLQIQIVDEEDNDLDIATVDKIFFNISTLTKKYYENSTEVTYDSENKIFKIWLTEEETFAFPQEIMYEARILFVDNSVIGTEIYTLPVNECLKKEYFTNETEDSEE